MAAKERITHDYLLKVLEYNPDTGHFRWKERLSRRITVGKIAGNVNKCHGYTEIGIGGRLYRAHVLAYFYMTGNWPPKEIDHIDLNKSNNAWANLRGATRAENQKNTRVRKDSSTQLKGAFLRSYGAYSAKIRISGEVMCLGTYKTAEEAHAAYCMAAQKYNGEFARTA